MHIHRWSTPTAALFGVLLAAGQSPAQVQVVSFQWIYPAETVYAADLSPFQPQLQPELFRLRLHNVSTGPETVVLRVRLTMEQPARGLLLEGTTEPFVVQQAGRWVTNRHLLSPSDDAYIDYATTGAAETLRDRLLETGRIPSGTFRLEVAVLTPMGMELHRAHLDHRVVNPTRVDLLAPGRRFGDPPAIVTTMSPRFLWTADGEAIPGLTRYRIRVVPVEDAVSGEEAMDAFAAWETVTDQTTALYPGSVEALRLLPGRTYAWQVIREIRTSGGTETVESPVYWFRMAGTAEVDADSDFAEILAALARALGLGDQLRGFRLDGEAAVDGRVLSTTAIEALLRAIVNGEVEIQSIIVR